MDASLTRSTLDERAGHFLLDLYRHSQQLPADTFCGWTFDRLQEVIPFDSAMWGHGTGKPVAIHDVHVIGQPPEMMLNYGRLKRRDFLAAAVQANPGKTIDIYDLISRADFERHVIYREHARHYGMEHLLCTQVPEPLSGLTSFISLWRADYDQPYSVTERALKQLLMPHLVEARRMNIFTAMRQRADGWVPRLSAVCDRLGVLHEAEDMFVSMVREAWPDWKGPRLPSTLCSALRRHESGAAADRGLHFSWAPAEGRVMLFVRPRSRVDGLSRRERQVADLLVAGHTHRKIAEQLGLGPNTIRSHIAALYRKLEIHRRAELSALLLQAQG
ncbi:MAG: helix-turn-helix transcriptional regulator [Burkholderiaceae bacterium]